MALPPQTNDAFLREVDDELRRDKVETFLRRWGVAVAIGIVAALIALGVGLWWQHHRAEQADASAEALSGLLQKLEHNDQRDSGLVLDRLATVPQPGYRGAAALLKADLKLQAGDDSGAAAGYQAVIDDARMPQPFRDAALLRLIAARFDQLLPDTIIARLRPLAQPGSPFFGSAGELSAMAYLKAGKTADAAALFAALARDKGVPETLRGRALQMANDLGVDVTPGAETQ